MTRQRGGPDLLVSGRDHAPIVTHQLAVSHPTWVRGQHLSKRVKPGRLLNRLLDAVVQLSEDELRALLDDRLHLPAEPPQPRQPVQTVTRGTIMRLTRATWCDTCGTHLPVGRFGLLYGYAPKHISCLTCFEQQAAGVPEPRHVSFSKNLRGN